MVAGGPLGVELLDQLLERQVLVRVRPQRRLPHPPQSSRNVGSPDTSVRRTSVFTKNPISPSSSLLVRPAIGEPTTTSLCPL